MKCSYKGDTPFLRKALCNLPADKRAVGMNQVEPEFIKFFLELYIDQRKTNTIRVHPR